jgi:acetyl esterase/lipase
MLAFNDNPVYNTTLKRKGRSNMKKALGFVLATVIFSCWGCSAFAEGVTAGEPKTELLWPNGAPGAKGHTEKDKPTMTIYLPPKDKATGAAVVIFPGGGYWTVAIDHEGHQIARWLNNLGIAGFIVDYRHRGRGYGHPAPIQDAQRAIRIVRSRAADFGIEPNKIGVIGFSAGGHLASTAGTHFDEKFYEPNDAIDGVSARPDFMILVYAVISMSEPTTHGGSREALLGKNVPAGIIEKFSNEKQVTSHTPPVFLVQTDEDKDVPAENSIYFYLALRKAGVPAELHIYRQGEHGLGLGEKDTPFSTWPDLCADWLASLNLCKKLNPRK